MNMLYNEIKKLYYNFDKILLLFASLFGVMEIIWIPLNAWLAESLLRLTGHAYLSPTNLLSVMLEKWWVTGLFLLLVVVNLVIAYLELAFILVGVYQLFDQRIKHLREYIRDVLGSMKQVIRTMTPTKVLFVVCYAVVLLPFLRKIGNIYYFNKLVVPQFVLDYLANRYLIGGVITTILLVFFWAASRLMYALPQIYFAQEPVREAVRFSWEKTKGKQQLAAYLRLLWIIAQTLLGFVVVAVFLYAVQSLADSLPDSISFAFALLHFIVLQLAYYGAIAHFMLKFVGTISDGTLPVYRRKRLRHRLRLSIIVAASLYFGVHGYIQLYYPFETLPVTISHRGVDNENGVQNTIDALKKTAALKPDYIEMDVQETKDGQFVVMHDTELSQLTGHSGGTHDYTLAELTAMKATENGMSSSVASFDDYLRTANQLGQKLLVEIKTNSKDSPKMMKHFLEKYGKNLIQHGHQMQSLDYEVILSVSEYSEELLTFFILPFNSIYPNTAADGYTMEYTSLDQAFVVKSWLRQKFVYAWTPNDETTMTQMIQMQADGIITDQLSLLQSVIADVENDRNYASLLFLQAQFLFYRF